MNGQHSSSHNARHPFPAYTVPLYDTTALTSALANPYAQHYAPHYYQAYWQAYSNDPPRTRDGYTLSSTYVPGAENQTDRASSSLPFLPPMNRSSVQTPSQSTVKPILNRLTHGTWYQPGNCRCLRQSCSFAGSKKSVEIHMMDRHFIFPPGWEKKDEWDADPSLRGKPIAIHGTSIVLDTPEAINAWITERKRRFPTAEKILDKKRKLEEAAARGQLIPDDASARARKRHKQNTTPAEGGGKEYRRQGYQRGRSRRWQDLGGCEESRTQIPDDLASRDVFPTTNCARETSSNSGSSEDDGPPEVVSSKALTLPPCIPNVDARRNSAMQRSHTSPKVCVRRTLPKKPTRNPFLSRPTLLRNLLLPEIQITVSNLSQAIHFLVENDFLHNVELRAGEVQERMIEVLDHRASELSNGM